MSDKNIKMSEKDYLFAEVVIKVAAIEKLLMKSGIFTTKDLTEEMQKISNDVAKFISGKMAAEDSSVPGSGKSEQKINN